MQRRNVMHEARGLWKSILPAIGVDKAFLDGKHHACPICNDGTDRFRFDNKDGKGTWICTHCGAGDGFELLKLMNGWDFKAAAREVETIIDGGVRPEPQRPAMDEERQRQARRELWVASRPTTAGDIVDAYLRGRGIVLDAWPALRTCLACPVSGIVGTTAMPAMLGVISDVDGAAATMHRTYLQDGKKASIDSPRRVMPGSIPRGGAIRLADIVSGKPLGIAEGIETALSAAQFFGHPVWAAISAQMMRDWAPPPDVEAITVYGDNDADKAFAGQRAAFDLAHRLKTDKDTKHLHVTVSIPPLPGTDWNDEVMAGVRGRMEHAA